MNDELRKLQLQAKNRLEKRKDPRFRHALDVFQAHGLLFAPKKSSKTPRTARITFEDIYFAGELEPRFFEVLPALAVRRPGALLDPWNMPNDLREVLKQIRKRTPQMKFKSFKPEEYMFWVNWLKRKNSKDRTIRKDFRFAHQDLERLQRLQKKLKAPSQSEVIRKALQSLENALNG